VKRQKKKEGKPVEVEIILNKKKIRGVEKYLVQWKGFTAEHDTWERKEDLGNIKEVLGEFEERMDAEIKRQEKINRAEE